MLFGMQNFVSLIGFWVKIMDAHRNKTVPFLGKISTFLLSAMMVVAIMGPAQALGFQEETNDYSQYSGEVVDESTNKPLVFATLAVEGTNISTISNTH